MYMDKSAPVLPAFAGKGELWPCDPLRAVFEFRALTLLCRALAKKPC